MIQKKFLYGLLMSMACLSACSNDEVETDNANNIRLIFDTELVSEAETRAAIVPAGNYPTGKTLKVLAVKDEGTSATVYENGTVTSTFTIVTAGEYNTQKKWPNHPLNFHAFSSASYPASWTMPSGTSTTFTAGDYTNTGTEDLLYAKSGARSGPAAVPLTLNHLLSRITFQFKKDGFINSEAVTITKITLENIRSAATGAFGTVTADDTPAIKSNATIGFSWTYPATPTRASYELDYTSTPVTLDTTFPADYLAFTTAAGNGDSWFMLPHALTDFGSTAKLTIYYKINSTSFDRSFQLNALKDKDNADVSTPWRMGEWTNYQITINANYITFKPITVAAWSKQPDVVLDI